MTKGRIAQLFDERQPFGERAGRSIADRLQLPPDYFEHDHYVQPGSRDALTALILAQFGDDREKLRSSVARLREMADQIESIVASPPSPRPPTGPAPEPAEPRSPKRGGKVG